MPSAKKTILITGCSDGGLGSALALEFHSAGWRVFASARNLAKLKETEAAGIESIQLDVTSDESIQAAVSKVSELTGGGLDALLNNAGGGYSMPLLDLEKQKVRDLFELNVFSLISVIQGFTPLLLQAHGMVINNTSVLSVVGIPLGSAYNASKAAAALLTSTSRLELKPLGIRVIELKTGIVKSNFKSNNITSQKSEILPPNSYYNIAKEAIEKFIATDFSAVEGMDRQVWAKHVVRDLSKSKPSPQIWRGAQAFLVWFGSFLPVTMFDGEFEKKTGLDVLAKNIKQQGGDVKPKAF